MTRPFRGSKTDARAQAGASSEEAIQRAERRRARIEYRGEARESEESESEREEDMYITRM